MSDRPRILLVEDEPRYVYLVQLNLEARGYEVLVARDGPAGIRLAATQDPALILLDIRLPGIDGYQVCQRIRDFSAAPIIMLTAMGEDADKVKGLDAGADDYITKPFSVDELLARVRAALRQVRRLQAAHTPAVPVLQAGALQIDFARQHVSVAGREIRLTAQEYELLAELARHAGHVVTSDHLLARIWGPGYEGEYRTLRQAIYRLRRKLESGPGNPQYIQTRSGLGYVLVLP